MPKNKRENYDMHTKVLTSLLFATFIGTSLSRSVSTSYQVDDGLSRQAKAGPRPDRMPIRRDWPGDLSQDQKYLVSQFLPHLYAAELANSFQDTEAHFPSWMDFGRRSSEDLDGDA
ncbi:gastrin/cholecystokinin-like peptide [Rhineura floridana]|uniref:gastrin/cholecystokinin-like peptide n=1 Tax=Rhineura floridana TaxID=261503 RepID=UPI002AC829B2|nr:gastrin/cholecystokinin-like peptide [Rhineura floridana]